MLLLAGFLVLFLKKTFDDEKSALEKEVGYVFVGAVRNIEGRLLDKIILKRKLPLLPGGLASGEIEIEKMGLPKNDSVRVMTFIQKEETTVENGDEKFDIRIDRREEKPGLNDLQGSISMVIKMESFDFAHEPSFGNAHEPPGGNAHEPPGSDSSQIAWHEGNFFPQLVASFDSSMAAAGLAVRHRVMRQNPKMKDSMAVKIGKIQTGSYTDMASGERFVAEISDYNWLIFKKITPQILLAALVFGMVALAFFSIWQSLVRQQKLTDLKNDLLQNISHELKTPVSTVGVALEALADFEVLKNPKRTGEYLEIAKNENSRLALLVDKVLGMAQFEKEVMPMNRAVFDLKKMTEDVLAAMRLQFEKHGAQVNFEAAGADFSFFGDRLHLSGVLFNLLDNALKYGGEPPEIAVLLSQNGAEIQFSVSDNGSGVPPEFQEKVFEKFFRVPTGSVHDVKGHGLGLSYVAAVVGQHGGRAQARGAVFTIQFLTIETHQKT